MGEKRKTSRAQRSIVMPKTILTYWSVVFKMERQLFQSKQSYINEIYATLSLYVSK